MSLSWTWSRSAAYSIRDRAPKLQSKITEISKKPILIAQRLVTGTKVFARVHTILPLHLILSLPNNLLAHVPITEISNTLTDLLRAEEEDSEGSDDGSDSSSAPDLLTLFQPGQYVLAKVLTLYPTASQSFISQYPVSETNRLAARVELSLMPEKVNSEIAKADVGVGYQITGEVLSEEDKGWRVGLGLNADNGLAGVEGWIKREKTSQDGSGERLACAGIIIADAHKRQTFCLVNLFLALSLPRLLVGDWRTSQSIRKVLQRPRSGKSRMSALSFLGISSLD